MGRIVWIASFPKSGNTWVRIFLTNYLRGTEAPAHINRLDVDLISSSRRVFDSMAGVESSELTDAEVQDVLPAVYRHLALSRDGLVFVKVHQAFDRTPSGYALFPADVTLAWSTCFGTRRTSPFRSPITVACRLPARLEPCRRRLSRCRTRLTVSRNNYRSGSGPGPITCEAGSPRACRST